MQNEKKRKPKRKEKNYQFNLFNFKTKKKRLGKKNNAIK